MKTVVKRCSVCGNEYEPWMLFCPRDSNELVAVDAPAEPAVSSAAEPEPGAADAAPPADEPLETSEPGAADAGALPPGATSSLFDILVAPEGRYRVLGTVVATPIGDVCAADDTFLNRLVTLLLVAPDMPEDEQRELFLRYRAMSAVAHPNVGTVYSLEVIDGRPAGVVESVDGPFFDEVLQAEAPLDVVRAASYARQIAAALDAIHEAHVVHKDVRPANLILSNRGLLKLGNFCQALVSHQSLGTNPRSDALIEKLRWLGPTADPILELAYVAPEQFEGGNTVDARADVYSLGAVLYHMLAGRPPFTGATVAELTRAVATAAPEPPAASGALEADLIAVAMRCLAKDPDERYASAAAAMRALDEIERRAQIAQVEGAQITPTRVFSSTGGSAAREDSIVTRMGPPVQKNRTTGERELLAVLPEPGDLVDGRYRIDALHGRGGMGAVYRATDVDLDRPLAIKVLHPQLVDDDTAMRRFRQEARASARLSHPNAVTVYGFGQLASGAAYIAMEMVNGITLREELRRRSRLSVEEVAHVLGQVADAVAAAHEAGLVHRDLKPDNVMLETRPGGVAAKVLDFGIAKLLSKSGGTDTDRLTVPQSIIGTPVYMSPEQARGDEIDARSDIYSLGVLVYEALTGTVPFTADTPIALALKHVTEPPPSLRIAAPDIPEAIDAVVMRTLAKDPNDRPQTAHALAQAFWDSVSAPPPDARSTRRADTPLPTSLSPAQRAGAPETVVASSPLPPIAGMDVASPDRSTPYATRSGASTPVVAVLPLRSLSSDRDDEFFAEGLTEEIITAFSRVDGVSVVSRTSAARFKSSVEPIRAIGDALGASHVLEGSVRRQGARARVTAQFVDVARDVHVWAENYDRTLDDVFAVQTEIARDVTRALGALLVECGGSGCNMHPYDVWLEGRTILLTEYFVTFAPEALERATARFHDALAIDNRYPDAWVSLSLCHYLAATDRGERARLDDAEYCAARALEIDANHAGAQTTLGWSALHRWKPDDAAAYFRRAIELNPGLAEARIGLGYALKARGMWDAAEAELETAARLNPHHTSPLFSLVDLAVWRGDLDRARDLLARALEMGRFTAVAARKQAQIHYAAGDYAAAIASLGDVGGVPALGQRSANRAVAALAHTRAGDHDRAREALDAEVVRWAESDPLGAELLAQVYSLLGDAGEALAWLRRAIAMGNENYPWLSTNPDFAPLAGDAPFAAELDALRERWEAFSPAASAAN